VTERLRELLVAGHRETLGSVIAAGATVAEGWATDAVGSAAEVREPLAGAISRRNLGPALLSILGAGATALDAEIAGEPVPAPPYLVVTSTGPICRATLADGRRLVLAFVLFGVDRRPRRYQFLDPTPAELLDVRLR